MIVHIKPKKAALLFCAAAAAIAGIVCAVVSVAVCVNAPAEKAEECVEVPILMYHSVCINNKVNSEYCLPPEKFEGDLRYLSEKGYTAVFISEIADYAEGKGELPEKPVAITLDDGYYNGLCNVLPLLKKYDMKATVSVVGAYTEEYSRLGDTNPSYAYLSWDNIKYLARSGYFEIGNHTYSMHELSPRKGCGKISGESTEHYKTVLESDVMKLQNILRERCGITPDVFAYPYGEKSAESAAVLKEAGFRAALTCDERINKIVRDPDILFSLGRINRASHYSTAAFMAEYGL